MIYFSILQGLSDAKFDVVKRVQPPNIISLKKFVWEESKRLITETVRLNVLVALLFVHVAFLLKKIIYFILAHGGRAAELR